MHVFWASCAAASSCHRALLLVLLVMACSLNAQGNFLPPKLSIQPTTTVRSTAPVRRYYLHNEVPEGSSEKSPGSFYHVINPWNGKAMKQRVQRTQSDESAAADSVDSFALLMQEWASRNSISKSDVQTYVASIYGGSIQNKRKRMVETADLLPGGYSGTTPKTRRTGARRRVHTPARQQVFEPMPPFKPPPSGTLLPDLFSNPRDAAAAVSSHTRPTSNTSSPVIAQRPPRPSSSNPGTVPRLDRKPDSIINQDPRRSDQVSQFDAESRSFTGQEPDIPRIEPNGESEDEFPGTGGSMEEEMRQPSVVPGSHNGVFAGRPHPPPTPTNEYEEFPAPEMDNPQKMPGSHPTAFNPRDVAVLIETRRLQLAYSVNAPPYFTFESLLSQLATFLMPGFCVDLAVTRRDEQCEIISHMAALKTDRLQHWQIEITDTGGKVIWFNQCMPDTRLFIVPGFMVSFRFVSHLHQPMGKSTPESSQS